VADNGIVKSARDVLQEILPRIGKCPICLAPICRGSPGDRGTDPDGRDKHRTRLPQALADRALRRDGLSEASCAFPNPRRGRNAATEA